MSSPNDLHSIGTAALSEKRQKAWPQRHHQKKLQPQDSQKVHSLHQKPHLQGAPGQLTMHDIINASLLKSTCHKIFVLSVTLERILYWEKHSIW